MTRRAWLALLLAPAAACQTESIVRPLSTTTPEDVQREEHIAFDVPEGWALERSVIVPAPETSQIVVHAPAPGVSITIDLYTGEREPAALLEDLVRGVRTLDQEAEVRRLADEPEGVGADYAWKQRTGNRQLRCKGSVRIRRFPGRTVVFLLAGVEDSYGASLVGFLQVVRTFRFVIPK